MAVEIKSLCPRNEDSTDFSETSKSEINKILDNCEQCERYYQCSTVTVLNDRLKELDHEVEIDLILTDSQDCDINMETDFEKAVEKLQEVDKLFARDEVQEMLYKAQAIAENLDVLERQAYLEGEDTQAMLDGKPLNEQFMQDSKEISHTRRVLVGIDMAYDEFYLMYDKDKFLPNSCCSVEVVTKEVAESNDKDMDAVGDEDKKNYKVGEILSYYRKLGDSGYYFRFL